MSLSDFPFFRLSPAGRAAAIMGTFFFGLIGLTTLWVSKEAQRISRQKQLSREANAQQTGSMVWIPAGGFTMGGIGPDALADELPLHDVKIAGFWLDSYEVTNAQWARFVAATGYVTVAERPRNLPNVPPELMQPGAWCFRPPGPGMKATDARSWWAYVPGASWRHPDGPASVISGKENQPVVQVCSADVLAYCQWAKKRLPTEAEWEYAARGGLIAQEFVWGSERLPGGKWLANVWQGHFPDERLNLDGFDGSAPVGSFPANGYGLYDMAGNVWELTSDWYRPDAYAQIVAQPQWAARRNPPGPSESYDPAEPGVPKKVIRGGSWMCSDNYCRGYRPSARMTVALDAALQNTGFRCARDGPAP